MSIKDTLIDATKADIQKIIAVGFLGIFGSAIIYFLTQAGLDITVSGDLDVNIFIGPFIGIIMGIFTWLGFKQGTQSKA